MLLYKPTKPSLKKCSMDVGADFYTDFYDKKYCWLIAVVVRVGFGMSCCFIISWKFMLRLQTAKINRHQSPAYGRRLAPVGYQQRLKNYRC
jgi:hypothetical protein